MPLADLGKMEDPLSKNSQKRFITNEVILEECERVMTILHEGAKRNEDNSLLWEGSLAKLFDGKRHLYSAVMKTLYACDSCRLLSRGSRNKQSLVAVFNFPTEEEVKKWRSDAFYMNKEDFSPRTRAQQTEQIVKNMRDELVDLRNRIIVLEGKNG